MNKPMQPTPAAPPGAQPGGALDIESIIATTRAKIPPAQQQMFDKVVLSGMRIMFDKNSHKMMEDQLAQPGPMPQKIATGIISLMYMLWTQSNKTIPPQLIVPATVVLTLRAFQFLQQSKDPEATTQVLGEAMAESVQGIMDRFGATQDRLPALLKASGQPGATAPAGGAAAPAAGAGLLSAAAGV